MSLRQRLGRERRLSHVCRIPGEVAASCAFMFPVSMPPNAIVFASGEIHLREMVKAGLWLNVIATVLVTLLTMLLIRSILVG